MKLSDIKVLTNVRPNAVADDALIESIKKWGILEPLLVRKDGKQFILVAGHRRLDGAKKAGLKEVPTTTIDITADEVAAVQVTENVVRRGLSPVQLFGLIAEQFSDTEKAEALSQVPPPSVKPKVQAIAITFGVARKFVLSALAMSKLTQKFKAVLEKGGLSFNAAAAIGRLTVDKMAKLEERFGNSHTIEDTEVFSWIRSNAERKLCDAKFDTAGCLSCRFNTGTADLFGGKKDELASCLDAVCWNKKKADTFRSKEKALLKNNKLPVVGSTSADWNGKLSYKGKPVHTRLEGEIAKLAKESEGKKEKDAVIGTVIVKDDNGPVRLGYVVLQSDKVKSQKLKVEPRVETDWEEQRFIKDHVVNVVSGLFLQKNWTDKQLLEMFNKNEEVGGETLAHSIKAYLVEHLNLEDMADVLNKDLDKLVKEQTPIAKAEYAKQKAAAPAAPVAVASAEDDEDMEE